jgi:hypothetical protein
MSNLAREMALACALQDGLPGFQIGREAECRVIGCELCQRCGKIVGAGLGLWLDRNFDQPPRL